MSEIKDYITSEDVKKSVITCAITCWAVTFLVDYFILQPMNMHETVSRSYIIKYVALIACGFLAYFAKLKELKDRDFFWWLFFIIYPVFIFIAASGLNITTKVLGDYGLAAVINTGDKETKAKKEYSPSAELTSTYQQAGFNFLKIFSYQTPWWIDMKAEAKIDSLNQTIIKKDKAIENFTGRLSELENEKSIKPIATTDSDLKKLEDKNDSLNTLNEMLKLKLDHCEKDLKKAEAQIKIIESSKNSVPANTPEMNAYNSITLSEIRKKIGAYNRLTEEYRKIYRENGLETIILKQEDELMNGFPFYGKRVVAIRRQLVDFQFE